MLPTFLGRRRRWEARWRFCCAPPRDVPQDASSWSPPAGGAPIQHPARRNWKRDARRQHRDSFAGKSSGDRVGDGNGASLVLQAEGIRKGKLGNLIYSHNYNINLKYNTHYASCRNTFAIKCANKIIKQSLSK